LNIVKGVKIKRLEKVERKRSATCIRALLRFGRKRNRSLIIRLNRSQREAAPLLPSRAKVKEEWTCSHNGQGTRSYLRTKDLQHIYIYTHTHIYIYIYITCSGYKYYDQNVYFTEISRTQVTDDF